MSGCEKRQYQIVVKGKVQRVGFRDKVEDLADEMGVCGYVENHPSKEVFILAEGDESLLDEFTRSIQSFPLPVKVKSLDVTIHPCEGTYQDFTIIRGDTATEFAERFDSAISYLHNIDTKQDRMLDKQDQMLNKQDQMLDKQDQMLNKQDQMLDKQDQMLNKQDQMLDKQDQMLNKQDQMLDKQDQMLDKQDRMLDLQGQMVDKQDQLLGKQDIIIGFQADTLTEVKGIRSDFQKNFSEELVEIRKEIGELRSAMIRAGYIKRADV